MKSEQKEYHNTLYILAAVWPNTKDNHAGMLHLANKIKRIAPFPVRIISFPTYHLKYLFWLYMLSINLVALWLRFKVKKGDTVWLMEYLVRTIQQSGAAKLLQGKACVIGTAHLVPKRLSRHYSDQSILRRINPLDRLYVFGNSLRDFLLSKGVEPEKVRTIYHYADTDYYIPGAAEHTGRLKVIAMGNMERDFDSLEKIVALCPDIDFIICLGMKKTDIFNKYKNVTTVGFVSEDELLSLMQKADISLNCMYDTIGSNVITTSLSCGLPVVASSVGSISDYVTDGKEGMLFDTAEQGAAILQKLDTDRKSLKNMSKNAAKKAEEMSVENVFSTINDDLIELTNTK